MDGCSFGILLPKSVNVCVLLAGLLTKKFVRLIQEVEDQTLDLNYSAEVLAVC